MNLNDLIRKSNEMGVTDIDWIKRCFHIANQNDQMSLNQKIELFGNYVIKAEPLPTQNFQNQNQNPQQEQTQSEAILEQIKQQSLRDYIKMTKGKYPRQENYPAGLRNVGNCCSINSTLQFLHQIPQITDWLFEIEIKQNNSVQSEFVKAWQELQKELETTQYHCVNPTDFIQKLAFQESEREYFENKTQKDATEILLLMLTKLDSSLRRLHSSFLLQTNLQRQECFGMQGLNQLFQITEYKNNNSDNHPMLQVQADAKNLKQYLLKDWSNRISILPQIMIFSINRITFNQSLQQIIRINTSFQFDKKINLDFLLYEAQPRKYKIQQPQQDLNYEKIQAQIKALEIIIDMYKNEKNDIQYTKLSLKKQLLIQQLESQQQNLIQSNFSSNNYYLHSVFIHIGGSDAGHIVVYIFNFYQDKWFKYNDELVTQISEEDMFQECEKDVVLITYVNNQQKQKITNHCKRLQGVGNKSIKRV